MLFALDPPLGRTRRRAGWMLALLFAAAPAWGEEPVVLSSVAPLRAYGEIAPIERSPVTFERSPAPAGGLAGAAASPSRTDAGAPEAVPPPGAAEPALLESAQPGADSASAGLPPEPASLWERIRAGFAMPELASPLVAEKERFYLSKPEYLQRMFARGNRYLYHIVDEIERRGMPTELALLPFVESAMNPVALSPAQAAGLWQFIPSTGRQYDLDQNWWVDNRRDVVKSTQAALEYLQKIYAMHGNDWFLALASYNWGEGAVARAVRKNQLRGRPADYLSLDMPAETRHYVPKLIALKNILLRAGELGVVLPELPNRPYFATIEKTRPIDLKLAAQFAQMSVEEFLALNPAHNRPVIAASSDNGIQLPADRVDAFLDAIDRHEEAKKVFASWQPYTLKPGESIESIAQRGGVPASELRRANGLRDSQRILSGTRILAPHASVEDESRVDSFVAPRVVEQVERAAVYHTVGRKESLASIAGRYGVSQAVLAAWNGLRQGVRRGMRLLVQPASTQTLLTTESGERQVLSSAQRAPAAVKVAAQAPHEGAAVLAQPSSRPQAAAAPARARGALAPRHGAAGHRAARHEARPARAVTAVRQAPRASNERRGGKV